MEINYIKLSVCICVGSMASWIGIIALERICVAIKEAVEEQKRNWKK